MSKLRFLFPILIALSSFSIYALPNITLYENGEYVCQIKNDKFYNADDELVYILQGDQLVPTDIPKQDNAFLQKIADLTVRKVVETEKLLIQNNFYDGKLISFSEYSKLTGNLVRTNFLFPDEQIYEYDEDSGLGTKVTWFTNGKIDEYSIVEYDSENRLVKGSKYDSNGVLLKYKILEYDSSDENLSVIYEYDSNNNLKSKTVYDTKTKKPSECYRYADDSKNSEKWTYLKFDEDGNYKIDENFFLQIQNIPNASFVFNLVETMTKDSFADFTEEISGKISKYDFSVADDGYIQIKNLKDKHYLISDCIFLFSTKLFTKNSFTVFCFMPDENYEIDISSCYKLEMRNNSLATEGSDSKIDYKLLNKAGKGKGPFGFDIGMNYDEVKEACGGAELEHIGDDRYYVKPKKTHPLFEKYLVWISDEFGLYYIKAISRDIYTSDYGTEAKNEFNSLLSSLEKKYGKFTKTDKVDSDSYLKSDKNWLYSLSKGARKCEACWAISQDNMFDYNGLMGIGLGISYVSYHTTSVWLEYAFMNSIAVEENEDDAL